MLPSLRSAIAALLALPSFAIPGAPVATLAAGTWAFAAPAAAADYTLKDLRILHPYARPTPPGARSGGIYLVVENVGKEADRLVGAASPAAKIAEIHSMRMEGNVMRMRPIAALDIPPGGKATLAPGGYHVMLSDLHAPLVAGTTVPLTLEFEKAGTIEVRADVEAAGAAHAGGNAPH
ncbi:MAG: copper chaperone PCu(A)C [Rudaea sp.]